MHQEITETFEAFKRELEAYWILVNRTEPPETIYHMTNELKTSVLKKAQGLVIE